MTERNRILDDMVVLSLPPTGRLAVSDEDEDAADGGAESREATALALTGERVSLGGGLALEVDLDGMDFGRLDSPGRVPLLHNHSSARGDVLGVVLAVDLKGDHRKRKRMSADVRFNEESAGVLSAIRAGDYPNGVSLGFQPMDYSVALDEETDELVISVSSSEMLELSVAPVPAVAAAGFSAAAARRWLDQAGLNHDTIRAAVKTARVKQESEANDMANDMANETAIETKDTANESAAPPASAQLDALDEGKGLVDTLVTLRSDEPDVVGAIKAAASESITLGENFAALRERLRSVITDARPHSRKVEAQMGDRTPDFSPIRLLQATYRKSRFFEDAAAVELGMLAERDMPTPTQGGTVIPMDLFFGRDDPERLPGAARMNLAAGVADYDEAIQERVRTPWISHLIARTPIMGKVTLLPGLVDNQEIPRLTSSVATAYRDDKAAVNQTSSEPAMDDITLSPKQLMATYEISNLLNLQTMGNSERNVRANAMDALASQTENMIINGDGSGVGTAKQPLGVLGQTAGTARNQLNTHDMPSAATAFAFADITAAMGEVFADLTPFTTSMALLTDQARFVSGLSTFIDTGSGISLIEGIMPPPMGEGVVEGRIAKTGMLACLSNHLNAAGASADETVVGLLGRWSDVLVGVWDTVEIIIDPYNAPGRVKTTIIMYHDVNVARASSFCQIRLAS